MENSGLVVLLEQDQYDDLARMYSLFKRLDDGLGLIRKMMGDHLKAAGSALVQDPESTKDPVDFVHRLLAMKDKYDRYRHVSCNLCLYSDRHDGTQQKVPQPLCMPTCLDGAPDLAVAIHKCTTFLICFFNAGSLPPPSTMIRPFKMS